MAVNLIWKHLLQNAAEFHFLFPLAHNFYFGLTTLSFISGRWSKKETGGKLSSNNLILVSNMLTEKLSVSKLHSLFSCIVCFEVCHSGSSYLTYVSNREDSNLWTLKINIFINRFIRLCYVSIWIAEKIIELKIEFTCGSAALLCASHILGPR